MNITHYNESHRGSLLALLEEVREYESALFDNYLLDSTSYLKNYLVIRDHMVFVAEEEGGVVGFMIGSHTTNYIVSVVILYVARTHRNQGIAFALKQALEDLSRLRGYEQIVSQVRTNNTASIALNHKSEWTMEVDKLYPDYYIWFTKDL